MNDEIRTGIEFIVDGENIGSNLGNFEVGGIFHNNEIVVYLEGDSMTTIGIIRGSKGIFETHYFIKSGDGQINFDMGCCYEILPGHNKYNEYRSKLEDTGILQ